MAREEGKHQRVCEGDLFRWTSARFCWKKARFFSSKFFLICQTEVKVIPLCVALEDNILSFSCIFEVLAAVIALLFISLRK